MALLPVHVLFVEDCNLSIGYWVRLDEAEDAEDFHIRMGVFVANAMVMIKKECKAKKTEPCMHIVPRSMTETSFAKLADSAAKDEMEGLISDVEHNIHRS